MRFVVVGAGAGRRRGRGPVVRACHEVVLVAQGGTAGRSPVSGLTVASATGVVVLPVPVQGSPQHVDCGRTMSSSWP